MENPIVYLITSVIDLYTLVIFVWWIMSLLLLFNVLNRHNMFLRRVDYALGRLVEPVLNRIRRFLPAMGGIDLSPVVLLLILNFIKYTLRYYF